MIINIWRFTLFVATIFLSSVATAQQSAVKLFAEIPVQFAAGYEGKISKRFSINVSGGLLTQPNSTLIVNVLEMFGTDEQVLLIIEDTFRFGAVGEVGLNFNFGKNYIGAFGQVIALRAGDTPSAIIESYFGTSISSYPARHGRQPASEKYLSLTSTLLQTGLLYGRRFPVSDRLTLFSEIGISANVYSKSTLSSQERDLSRLSIAVDSELAGYYSEYAFVPSVTVGVAYGLKK